MRRARQIGVIGASACEARVARAAETVGELVARRGDVLITGGLGGVMEAASRGAHAHGATVVGILPGRDAAEGNTYLSIAIPSGMGEARNAIVVQSSDGLIAIDGGYGTLSEMAFALKAGKPLVSLWAWRTIEEVTAADSPEEAVALLYQMLEEGNPR